MDGDVYYDPYSQNFEDIFRATNILYSLISFDGYPDCMIPAITYSSYFLIYFILYLVLQLLVFLPVPVAIVFEAYRLHRSDMVFDDRIKQKEALLATFVALD